MRITVFEKIAGLVCYLIAGACFLMLLWALDFGRLLSTGILAIGLFFAAWGWNLRHNHPDAPDAFDDWL